MSLQVGYLRPELQGCSPLASQQLIVTTWKFFLPETGELSIMQISFCNFMLYPPHVHAHAPEHTILAHRYRLSITIYTMEDRHARWTPIAGTARNTQSSVSPWDAFMLVFSPHNFPLRGFLEGFFSVGMLATYPK